MLKTLKFKLTLLYSCIYIVSSVLIAAGVYYFSRSLIIKQTNNDLISIARNLEKRFLKGDDYENENIISLHSIPSHIISVAQGKIKNLKPVYAKVDLANNNKIYEVTGIDEKYIFEIKISSSGKILEVEKSRLKNGLEALKNEIYDLSKERGENRIYIILFDEHGRIKAKSNISKWMKAGSLAENTIKLVKKQGVLFRVVKNQFGTGRLCVVDKQLFNGNILEIGTSVSAEERLLNSYLYILIAIFSILFLLGTLSGWIIAKKAMSGIERVTLAATAISSGSHLSNRVASGNEGSEIEKLVNAFNEMLSRINLLVSELKEVSDNIAHDLRTPLTRIRGIVETTLDSNPNETAYREMSADVVEECDRLVEIVNTMLEITQTDSGVVKLNKTDIDLKKLLLKAFDLFSPMAAEKQLDFNIDLPDEVIYYSGDKSRIQRMFANLIDNAIKYTQKGSVTITLQKTHEHLIVNIKDTGCGISEKEQQHIFDRFYRCDSSRTLPGSGLGLSLAYAIIKAHSGNLTVYSIPGKGSTFSVEFYL